MTVQHKDIVDANLHEVKGASTATSGEVPVASGSGTAPFRRLITTDLDVTNGKLIVGDGSGIASEVDFNDVLDSAYAEMTLQDETTAVVIAASSTWTEADDPTWTEQIAYGITTGGTPKHHFVIPYDGIYRISLEMAFDTVTPAVSQDIEYGIMVNGTQTGPSQALTFNNTSDKKFGSLNTIQPLTAADEVSVAFENNTDTSNILIVDAVFNIQLIRKT